MCGGRREQDDDASGPFSLEYIGREQHKMHLIPEEATPLQQVFEHEFILKHDAEDEGEDLRLLFQELLIIIATLRWHLYSYFFLLTRYQYERPCQACPQIHQRQAAKPFEDIQFLIVDAVYQGVPILIAALINE
jgi:hypothetical protein